MRFSGDAKITVGIEGEPEPEVPLANLDQTKYEPSRTTWLVFIADADNLSAIDQTHCGLLRELFQAMTSNGIRLTFDLAGSTEMKPLPDELVKEIASVAEYDFVGDRGGNVGFKYGEWFSTVRMAPVLRLQYMVVSCLDGIKTADALLIVTDNLMVLLSSLDKVVKMTVERLHVQETDATKTKELQSLEQFRSSAKQPTYLVKAKCKEESFRKFVVQFLDNNKKSIADIDISIYYRDNDKVKVTFAEMWVKLAAALAKFSKYRVAPALWAIRAERTMASWPSGKR